MFIEHFVMSMKLYDNYDSNYRQSRSEASSSLWNQGNWTDCICKVVQNKYLTKHQALITRKAVHCVVLHIC